MAASEPERFEPGALVELAPGMFTSHPPGLPRVGLILHVFALRMPLAASNSQRTVHVHDVLFMGSVYRANRKFIIRELRET